MTADAVTLAEIGTDLSWVSSEIDPGLLPTYKALVRSSPQDVPAGLVVVWARRAFSRGRSLPAGGVLLGIDVELDGDLPLLQGPDSFRVDVDVRRRDGRRPVVTIVVALRVGSAAPFARVSFTLLWPEPA